MRKSSGAFDSGQVPQTARKSAWHAPPLDQGHDGVDNLPQRAGALLRVRRRVGCSQPLYDRQRSRVMVGGNHDDSTRRACDSLEQCVCAGQGQTTAIPSLHLELRKKVDDAPARKSGAWTARRRHDEGAPQSSARLPVALLLV